MLTLLLHEDDPVGRAGHGAADVNEIASSVDALNAKMCLRMALSTIMPGHLLSLDDTRRIGAGADGAGTTVLGVAVGVGTAVESIALHDALESATLGSAGDLDLIARRENLDRDLVAKVVGGDFLPILLELRVVETEAAENLWGDRESSLGGVTDDSLVRTTAARRPLALLGVAGVTLLAEAKLDR